MDAMDFISAVKLGQIVILRANANYTGRTSMEIGVRVMSEDPLTGKQSHTASAYLTFVAVDKSGKPVEVPPLNPKTEEEKKWYKEGEARRRTRLAAKKGV